MNAKSKRPAYDLMLIAVPAALHEQLEELVRATAKRLGEPVTSVRRAVEIAVLQRGIDELKTEGGRG